MHSIIDLDVNNKDQVVLAVGEQFPIIVSYLEESLDTLRTLEYFIEDVFMKSELKEVLNEDLPLSHLNQGRELFVQHINHLSYLFFTLSENKKIKIKLELIKSDMCRLFHVDNIRQRLLCTYIGLGTEWLESENANYQELGKGCNEKIVKDFSKVNKAKPFDILLLKGLKYGDRRHAIVHRSPPIEDLNQVRVLLKIDEV